jgi:hypothetical protein
MRVFLFYFTLTAAPLLLFPSFGCDSDAAHRVPVRGQVSYHGSPLSTGMIVFVPDPTRGCQGPLARSNVQNDGRYNLCTDESPGVCPGWYRVTIAAVAPAPADQNSRLFVLPKSLVPDKYRDPELSGLACEVRAGKENCINFNLE